MADAWRSRVRVYARGVARNLIAGTVRRGKEPHPNVARCLLSYADDTDGDDEHGLQGAGASAGVCPGGGHRESRFASASWAASTEDEQIERVDIRRQLEAAVAPGPDHGWQVALLAEISPSSFGVPLIAEFDRSEFWDRMRAFATKYVPKGAPSRNARAKILSMLTCPPELVLTSSTPLHAVVDRYRGHETSRSFRKKDAASPTASLDETLSR